MHRFARAILAVSALSLGLMLAACESFDPTDVFSSDMFVTKKKLPGDRQPVFPDGTPGVPQGVPAELIKGNQAAAEPVTTQAVPDKPEKKQAAAEPEAKAKPKPKPKVVARPAEPASTPTSVTVRRSDGQQWPDPPGESAQQQQPQAQAQPQQGGAWPGAQRGGSVWPDPPR